MLYRLQPAVSPSGGAHAPLAQTLPHAHYLLGLNLAAFTTKYDTDRWRYVIVWYGEL